MQTKITKMFGIKYPIIGGTMMSISRADFVAAISNAGGLGILASCIYTTREEFSDAIDRIKQLTDKPFAVNINLFPSMRPIDNNIYVDILVEKGVKIVETSGHSAPEELCERFKKAGMIWIHKCVGIKYAKKVEKMGADIVTVVGYENGGATGKLDTGTMVLVPAIKDAIDLPVIGGGGISDGRGVAALLALGADAVIIGTRLLLTKECPIHENIKNALCDASELDTMLIMRSIGATHRVWNNAAAQKCQDIEDKNQGFEAILDAVAGKKAREMFKHGDIDAGILALGQTVGLINDIPAVKDLFTKIMKDAQKIVNQLNSESINR